MKRWEEPDNKWRREREGGINRSRRTIELKTVITTSQVGENER